MAAITSTLIATAAIASAGYGAYSSINAAEDQKDAQNRITSAQQRQEALRMQAMELDNRRKQMEALRTQQRARALALATATNQGAGQSTGLEGAYGQTQGMSGNNLLGLNQGLQLGQANFALNSSISAARMDMASAQSQAATGQAFTQFGGTLMANMGTISKIGQSFGSSSGGSSQVNPNWNMRTSQGAIY